MDNEYKEKYNSWLESREVDPVTGSELMSIAGDENEIKERFYKDLRFGTGGLRGKMGAGTDRMNIYTVRRATQGLADYIQNGSGMSKSGIVIAYDSRNHSKEFAWECVRVLSANGIKVYIFDDLRPTPELSFAIRYLGCAGGIVITASHNPKEYNGYKIYGGDGGQITPETAKRIKGYIDSVDIFKDVKVSPPIARIIGPEVDVAYIEAIKKESFGVRIPRDLKVVYTPLHGSANKPVRQILTEIGVEDLFVVPEQEKPDGNFPTVSSPNPENSEAFDIAVEYAKKQAADLVFGTDPDGDRIGVVVRDNDGRYFVLNGNQTGCLLCEYILRKRKELGTLNRKCAIVKTIVTTEMVRAIADDYQVNVVDVLTGFKYIGDRIKALELEGSPENFVFGLEESYGYLKGTYARDKDAVVAAMLITEAAADYKARGLTLYDGLVGLYKKYGFYLDGARSVRLDGLEGAERIRNIMDRLRQKPYTSYAGMKVIYFTDLANSVKYNMLTGERYSVDLPRSDVIKLEFDDEAQITIRPSGTEPKLKLYCSARSDSYENAKDRVDILLKFPDTFL